MFIVLLVGLYILTAFGVAGIVEASALTSKKEDRAMTYALAVLWPVALPFVGALMVAQLPLRWME